MSNSLTSSSSDKRRKAPVLDPEDFCAWEMMFQAYVGFSEWELFESPEPVVDPTVLQSHYNADGHATVHASLLSMKNKLELVMTNGNQTLTK